MADVPTERRFYVAAWAELCDNGGCRDCLIYETGGAIPLTHENVYGPASHAECEAWAASNCANMIGE